MSGKKLVQYQVHPESKEVDLHRVAVATIRSRLDDVCSSDHDTSTETRVKTAASGSSIVLVAIVSSHPLQLVKIVSMQIQV